MALTITIKGNGNVDKVVDGNSTTLTAKPSDGWNFKYFQIGSDEIKDNPYSFEAVGEVEVLATFYMSIVSYLKGKVGFEIPDSSLDSILADRGINADTDISDLTVEQRELFYADVLMWAQLCQRPIRGQRNQMEDGFTLVKHLLFKRLIRKDGTMSHKRYITDIMTRRKPSPK